VLENKFEQESKKELDLIYEKIYEKSKNVIKFESDLSTKITVLRPTN